LESFRIGPLLTIAYDASLSAVPQIMYVDAAGKTHAIDSRLDQRAGTVSARLTHFSAYLAAATTNDLQWGVPIVETTVTGTVTTSDGGLPVEHAVVQGRSASNFVVQTTTDATGAFSIGVTRELWEFRVTSAPGFHVQQPF